MLLSSKHRWIGSDHQQHLQFMQYWVYNLYIYKEIVIDFRSSVQLLKDTKMFHKNQHHRTAMDFANVVKGHFTLKMKNGNTTSNEAR